MPAPRKSVGQDGDTGEAAAQSCRGIFTASASHSHCTCFNAAVVPLPPAQLPGGASQATCWPIGPLQQPLRAPGRFTSKLPGSLWGTKRRWILYTVSNAVRYLAPGRSFHRVPFGKGTKFMDLLQFPK